MKSAVILCLALCVAAAVARRYPKYTRHYERRVVTEETVETEDEQQPKIWALLVAGSNGWGNYRHQADVCHAYKILRQHGIPEERIVTMMYDDIADNSQNPYPGKIYNRPEGDDVYEGVVKDYVKDDVTPQNFLDILQGNKSAMRNKGSGKVIESGPNDHVFVYFTDHGATGLVAFPNDVLNVKPLNDALKKMSKQKKFKQLVFYLEACESGSMFKRVLPANINIYAITASNDVESSWGCYCENDMHLPCLGDLFSVNWMQDSDVEDLTTETLQKQFEIVVKETNKSHVQHYGDLKIAKESVANFQGFKKAPARRFTNAHVDKSPWPVHDIALMTLRRQRDQAETEKEHSALTKQIHRLHQKRQYLVDKMTELVEGLVHDPVNRRRILKQHPDGLTELACHDTVTKAFNRICFPFSQNPYALKYVYVLANLCEEGIDQERILREMQDVCIDVTLPLGGVE